MKQVHELLNKKYVLIIVVIVLLIAVLVAKPAYFYLRYTDTGEREAATIISKISGNVALPEETAALATVTDTSKLTRGGVLASAKNGDKVLLFYKAAKAVLYRPSIGKVIEIGPIVLDPSASQVRGTRIEVRNGTGDVQKFQTIVQKLKQKYPTAEVVDGGKAQRSNYPKTVVVDLSGAGSNSKAEFSNAIIDLLGAQQGVLPLSEQKPASGILIIVGNDT